RHGRDGDTRPADTPRAITALQSRHTDGRMGERMHARGNAVLALEDGRLFHGEPFGATVEVDGEVVFTTIMTGYQEVVTDPSFDGQIVTFTYPLIGNYGVTPDDDESWQPWVSGVIVREYCDEPSYWRSEGTFADYLRRHNIPGIMGVDTRAL